MDYFGSLAEAFGMLFQGQFTQGTVMILSGCVLMLLGSVGFLTSFSRNRRKRKKLLYELNNG